MQSISNVKCSRTTSTATTSTMSYLFLFLVSILTCFGQLCQKQASDSWQKLPQGAVRLRRTISWLFFACLLLALAMLLWLIVLRSLPVSLAYPMLSFNFVLITLAAHFIFKEKITARHSLGVATIIAGLFFMGLG